ncbi:MAG: AAA family ATPase [Hydrogenophaga sp.]|uniref:AAA family ATPase n=1 Tax=Hydrogenophaga sp. TaxID=1904254 RepID=UPI002AB9AAE5|nr:AAA family ATPase [Hydrogenophaga sp.]MDZ4282786.1 AAA family ATPase [Hydrogenophaga sp.]
MNPVIRKDTALVIVGPQGCGKSLLARELAAKAGVYVELDISELSDEGMRKAVLSRMPKTLIVNGLPRTSEQKTLVKSLITDPDAPCLVFCDNDPPRDAALWRRFRFHRMQTH